MVTRRTGFASRTKLLSYIWLETQTLLVLLRALVPCWELRLPGAGAPLLPWSAHPCPPQWRRLCPHHCQPVLTQDRHTCPRPSWPWSKPQDSHALVPSTLWQGSGFYFQQQNENYSQGGSVPHGSIPQCLQGTAESFQRVSVPEASAPLSLCSPSTNK